MGHYKGRAALKKRAQRRDKLKGELRRAKKARNAAAKVAAETTK